MLTQRQIQLTILRYLYANDDGELHHVQAAFKRDIPSRARIEDALYELGANIELESIYVQHGILFAGDPIPETRIQKAKISQQGRLYWEAQKEKSITKVLAILGIAATLIGGYLTGLFDPKPK